MLRRVLMVLALCMFAQTAAATPELARQWGEEATRLQSATNGFMTASDHGEAISPGDDYLASVDRFGRTSARLGEWIDNTEGPKDLGCIFRGMSAEASAQLMILDAGETQEVRRQALVRLATMFSDAALISDAAAKRAPTPTLESGTGTGGCSADPDAVRKSLKNPAW